MLRPSSMAATMVAKLSSRSTRSATSRLTSEPLWPMATPTSARLRAGASFTPSPVMATTSPAFCRASTILSFCSGLTRAKTSTFKSSSSESASSSSPVATTSAGIPTLRAMARAVAGWSPVTITTRTPAFKTLATASGTSGRGGPAGGRSPRSGAPPPLPLPESQGQDAKALGGVGPGLLKKPRLLLLGQGQAGDEGLRCPL